MRMLFLVAVLGIGALVFGASTAEAQIYPVAPFGTPPFRYNFYNPGYGYGGNPAGVVRYGFGYPSSGYNWGFARTYNPYTGAIAAGYYRGYTTPFYSNYQFMPTYYNQAYFNSAAAAANYGQTYAPVYPGYYLPTY